MSTCGIGWCMKGELIGSETMLPAAALGDNIQNGVFLECVGGGEGVGVREGVRERLDDEITSLSVDFLLYIAAASTWRRIVELRGPLSCWTAVQNKFKLKIGVRYEQIK